MTACGDRGADLFLAARGGPAAPGLDAHLAACAACRAELEALRPLARDLPAASAGIRPRPGTRAAVLAAAVPTPLAAPPPPRPLPARGRILRLWIPAGVAAASVAATVLLLLRPPVPPPSPAPGVEVTTLWEGAALEGAAPGGLPPGAVLSARRTSSARLGSPVLADVVLGEGASLRVPPGNGTARSVDLLSGAAWFDPGSAAASAGTAPPPLVVRAGPAAVEDRGARFAVERRASGAVAVTVEAGVVVVRAGGRDLVASGPCRIDVSPEGAADGPHPAEPADASAWFAYPEVLLESAPAAGGGAGSLGITLRPSVPREIRIAPWERFDPLFSLVTEIPGRGQSTIAVNPRMLRRPPPSPDSDGAFLLGPARPYRMEIDPGTLGLPPGEYRLVALYTASRPGGLWRGTRASNPVDIVVR